MMLSEGCLAKRRMAGRKNGNTHRWGRSNDAGEGCAGGRHWGAQGKIHSTGDDAVGSCLFRRGEVEEAVTGVKEMMMMLGEWM